MDERRQALQRGNMSLCRRLFAGPLAFEAVEGVPPIGWAVESGSVGLVKWLLSRPGADADARDQDGRTPLLRLMRASNSDLTELSRKEVMQYLLARGADPTLGDDRGESPRILAESYFPELLPQLQGGTGAPAPPRPPLRRLPKAKAWKGKSRPIRLRGKDLLGWALAAGMVGATAFVLLNPSRFLPAPRTAPKRAQLANWKVHWEEAQRQWNIKSYGGAASAARAALECDLGAQSEKGPVYSLAMQACLKEQNLKGAYRVLQDYGKRGPYSPSLDAEMEQYRLQLSRQGSEEVSRRLEAGWAKVKAGNYESARAEAESARRLAALLSVPAGGWEQLKQEADTRQQAQIDRAAGPRAEHRRKQLEEEERRHPRSHYRPETRYSSLPASSYPTYELNRDRERYLGGDALVSQPRSHQPHMFNSGRSLRPTSPYQPHYPGQLRPTTYQAPTYQPPYSGSYAPPAALPHAPVRNPLPPF